MNEETAMSVSFNKNQNLCCLFLLTLLLHALPVNSQTPAWLHHINNQEEWVKISIAESSRSDMQRATKFLAPVENSGTLLSTVYQNVNKYRLHIDFMTQEFPQYFGGLSSSEYLDLVYYRSSRSYFAGAVYQFKTIQGEILYGFNVYHDHRETLTVEEAALAYARISESFQLRPLAYAPVTPGDIQTAKQWKNPGFPVYFPEGLIEPEYEVYSMQSNYGRIRLFTLVQMEDALEEGLIGWQDIVVVDQAPSDIESVVAGIVTGTRQGELSHVNVRALRRGTPNAYVQNPLQAFAAHKDRLVKLSLTAAGYTIDTNVTLDEAEDWWDRHRPQVDPLPQPNDETADFLRVNEPYWSNQLVKTYGGKGGQLSMLYQFLSPEHQVNGFAIPFHFYQAFMQTNSIHHPIDPALTVTYEEYIAILTQDERFRSDSAYRRQRLNHFVNYARDYGKIDSSLVERILAEIYEVFGSHEIKVRFRSSSNAEDNLIFNGAGLYDSTSVCPLDDLDGDNKGPSHCDPTAGKERTVERGLKKVWMSLWNPKAFDEREYYRVDHERVRMGVLVTRAFPDEDANGVAFSGDPVTGNKDYYIVNVQKGDESVVQPGNGIVPEKDLIHIDESGVKRIERARKSSLMHEGQWVLTDAQLTLLGTVLHQIEQWMPVDLGFYSRNDVIMDIEFKFDDGGMFIKQVRPLLSAVAQPIGDATQFRLIVPEDTRLAGVFQDNRTIEDEYRSLSLLYLREGEHDLPIQKGEYEIDLIERIEYSPDRIVPTAKTNGRLIVEVYGDEIKFIDYSFQQTFTLPDGQDMDVVLSGIRARYEPGMDEIPDKVLTEEVISDEFIYANALMMRGEEYDFIRFASITYQSLPLFKHSIDLSGGGRIELYRRFQEPFAGSGPANLVYGIVDYSGNIVHQGDYWKLVYAAEHHNWDEQYWVLFNSPFGEAYGIAVDTFTFEKDPVKVYLLDRDLNRMRELEVQQYEVEQADEIPRTSVGEWRMY